MSQKVLLGIVQTWSISEKPEYRGFRCASCQKYLHKAWHYYLRGRRYNTPVHFCNVCKAKLSALKNKGIYKGFTCDNCRKKMYKAWHVWSKKGKGGVMSEAHLCKQCGDRLKLGKEIKGVIYDLDGTIISTIKLHEAAWLYAAKKFNIPISPEMLIAQRGISNEAAASLILPKNKKHLSKDFIDAKAKYVLKNVSEITFFPYASKVIDQLLQNGYRVWICTSAPKNYVKKILNNFSKLKRIIKNNIVWRGMYKNEKPSPEVLNLIIKKMGLTKSQACYVGDIFVDYKTGVTAEVKFIYFCPNLKKRDLRIPKSIPTILSHREIFKLLK